MKYRIISIISVFILLISMVLGLQGMNIDDANVRERTGCASAATYAEATGQEESENIDAEGEDEEGEENDKGQADPDADPAGDDTTDPDQTDEGSGDVSDGQTVTDPQDDDNGTPADQQTADQKDTIKTDSKTDAAPKDLDLTVTEQDRTAVLNTPNSPVDASEVSGSRARADGKYEAFLEKEYGVVFSDDFALIMEEIENEFELRHGLISEKAYKMRADRPRFGLKANG